MTQRITWASVVELIVADDSVDEQYFGKNDIESEAVDLEANSVANTLEDLEKEGILEKVDTHPAKYSLEDKDALGQVREHISLGGSYREKY